MDKKTVEKAIAELKKDSQKRNFKQSFDVIFIFKNLDLKKQENQLDFFVTLHNSVGKKKKICALVDSEMINAAKESCDKAIIVDDFENYTKNKKDAKKLANEYDFFMAQANIMGKVAGSFGRTFGPRGKMPNPKSGSVFPPKANIKLLNERLQKTVRINLKKALMAQIMIGKEDQNEEEVVDNIITLYNQIIHNLPNEKNNLKSVSLKLTMSKPIKLE
jgi:large subunit ribosomal protein L1